MQEKKDQTLLELYEQRDTESLTKLVDSDPNAIRKELTTDILSKFLLAKSRSDGPLVDSLVPAIAWLIDIYTETSDLVDVSGIWELYSSWNSDEAKRKIECDSLYRWVLEYKRQDSIISTLFRERLSKIRFTYSNLGDSFYLASVDFSASQDFYEQSVPDSGDICFQRAIAIANSIGFVNLIGDCHLWKAAYFANDASNFEGVVREYRMAADAFRKARRNDRVAYAYLGIGYTQFMLNNPLLAIENLQTSLAESESIGDTLSSSYAFHLISESFSNLGLLDSAERYERRALRLREMRSLSSSPKRKSQRLLDVAYSESTLGWIHYLRDEFNEAEIRYVRADSLFGSLHDSSGRSLNRMRYADMLNESGREDSARVEYSIVMTEDSRPEVMINCLFGLAIGEFNRGRLRNSIRVGQSGLDLLEEYSKTLASMEIRSGFLADKIELYNLQAVTYLKLFATTDDSSLVDSCLFALELSRSKSLSEEITDSGFVTSPTVDSLVRVMSELYRAETFGKIGAKGFKDSLAALDNLLAIARLNTSSTASPNKSNRSHSSGFQRPHSRNLEHIVLPAVNGLVLEYLISRFGCYVLAHKGESHSVFQLSTTQSTIDALVRRFSSVIERPPAKRTTKLPLLSTELYDVLFPLNVRELMTSQDLFIIPSGRLYELPFAALSNSKGEFLIESHNIRYFPSHSVMNSMRDRRRSDAVSGVIVFGDAVYDSTSGFSNLKYSSAEIASIRAAYPTGTVTTFAQGEASESNLKGLETVGLKSLHLSLHGVADQVSSSRSYLRFSLVDDYSEDGRLGPDDIVRLNIEADLVFLSACETADGRMVPGEGVLSLARSFIVAGANSVIATMWQVDDRFSAEFVKLFYTKYSAGQSVSGSLSYAQQATLASPRALYRDPYYWAPFVHIGID